MSYPRTWDDFRRSIGVSGNLESLRQAVQEHMGEDQFFAQLVPNITNLCQQTQHLLPSQGLCTNLNHKCNELPKAEVPSETIELTQMQCLCILSNSFLCTWPGRTSCDCRCHENPDLPSINFDDLFSPLVPQQVAKCRHLFEYFERQFFRLLVLDEKLTRTVKFIRKVYVPSTDLSKIPWLNAEADVPLCPLLVHPLHKSIEEGERGSQLKVDFANATIGGAAIAYGCVQEEILFAEHPEMICARLYFTTLQANEALVIIGAEKFSTHRGYKFSLQYHGAHFDIYDGYYPHYMMKYNHTHVAPQSMPSNIVEIKDNTLQSYYVAMDAISYFNGSPEEAHGQPAVIEQYHPRYVERELMKAFVAFNCNHEHGTDIPNTVATGNWGCGAFGGDPALKSIIQWIACSIVQSKAIHYFPFDNQHMHNNLPMISSHLIKHNITPKCILRWMFKDYESIQQSVANGTSFFELLLRNVPDTTGPIIKPTTPSYSSNHLAKNVTQNNTAVIQQTPTKTSITIQPATSQQPKTAPTAPAQVSSQPVNKCQQQRQVPHYNTAPHYNTTPHCNTAPHYNSTQHCNTTPHQHAYYTPNAPQHGGVAPRIAQNCTAPVHDTRVNTAQVQSNVHTPLHSNLATNNNNNSTFPTYTVPQHYALQQQQRQQQLHQQQQQQQPQQHQRHHQQHQQHHQHQPHHQQHQQRQQQQHQGHHLQHQPMQRQ